MLLSIIYINFAMKYSGNVWESRAVAQLYSCQCIVGTESGTEVVENPPLVAFARKVWLNHIAGYRFYSVWSSEIVGCRFFSKASKNDNLTEFFYCIIFLQRRTIEV